MDFSALPPEINSARIYSGPGAGPLLAAATAWDGLAAELQSMAASYSSAIAELTGQQWQGPASAAMVSAATPYLGWLTTTAAQAQQTAIQAKAAASAYAAAFAMTVPPPVVAANRSLLMSLIATNVLGQNTPAIAVTEAQYGEMWAQDAATMEIYAGSSAQAAQLTPFTSPPQTTDPAGQARQAAAVTQAATPNAGLEDDIIELLGDVDLLMLNLIQTAGQTGALGNFAVQAGNFARTTGLGAIPAVPAAPLAGPGAGLGISSFTLASASGADRGPAWVSASAGRAASVGALTVPQSWAAPPEIRQLARSLPVTSAAPMAALAAAETPYAGLGLASMAGGGMGGLAGLGAAGANTAAAAPAVPNVAAAKPVKPAARPAATPPTGAVTIPTENIAASLAATLAAMPGATVVVIPPPPAGS